MRFRSKLIAGILIGTMALSSIGLDVSATDVATTAQTEEEATAAAYAMPIETNGLENWPQGPAIYGEGGIVMDMKSGAILYGKNVDCHFYPASITKVLTALIALENAKLTDTVTFSQESIDFLEYGDAHIGMMPGEQISLEDALYGVLLASANEVSHAVAESTVEGGYDAFIAKMNERAKELGCNNSNFVNPHGLHDDNHYTCARDMALIASEVFKHEEFRTITNTLQHTIAPTNLCGEPRIFQQNHKMLYEANTNYYPYCVGGKTGFTDQALTTLVTFADDGNMQLVAVNMRTHGKNVYPDTRNMMDYAFGNFHKESIVESEKKKDIEKFEDEDAYVVIPNNLKFTDLKCNIELTGSKKDREGMVTYTYKEQPLGSAKVVLSKAYIESMYSTKDVKKAESKTSEKETKKKSTLPLKLIIAAIVVVFAAGGYIYWQILLAKKRKRRRERQRRHRQQRNRKEY
ncbi:D-alanyl-D-alanine carboxypeptidase family protein [Lachnospiraceae bacterium LCP25S3_G4]